MVNKRIAPEVMRIAVKAVELICYWDNGFLHRTEFAAKAMSAKIVRSIVVDIRGVMLQPCG